MSQDALRPQASHQEYQKLKDRDVRVLFGDSRLLIERDCPLCGSRSSTGFAEKDGLKYRRCGSCSLVFLSPLPALEKIQDYYRCSESASYFHGSILKATENTRYRSFEERFDKVLEFQSSEGSATCVLDLGCSVGTFLKAARAKGWAAYGIEPNETAREQARLENLSVEADFEALRKATGHLSVSVLTAWEVIAHLVNPVAYLQEALSFVDERGFFILTTPNVEGLEYRLLKEKHHNLGFPFLQFFSSETLPFLFQKIGVSLLQLETPGQTDLETILNAFRPSIEASENLRDVFFGTHRRDLALRQALQKALRDTLQSGHLWAVGARPIVHRGLIPQFRSSKNRGPV